MHSYTILFLRRMIYITARVGQSICRDAFTALRKLRVAGVEIASVQYVPSVSVPHVPGAFYLDVTYSQDGEARCDRVIASPR